MLIVQAPLADVIRRLQTEGCPGNVLIIDHPATGYYIQIAGGIDSPHLHVEAVSNRFLEPDRQLSPEREKTLEQLGWAAPAKGCPNHAIDCQSHGDEDRQWLSNLIEKTFSSVYGISDRNALVMKLSLEIEFA
ncbi:MAG TPA: hypothetical protein PLU72_19910 [Candidatus Ozemobacteraceae bacterium]|nr:hypothetical protein [Candidatus Ozemobacteraceae bacterium]HQG29942.1 hypothetical protein [Candidatus Ozemobacteraceae bacterium]